MWRSTSMVPDHDRGRSDAAIFRIAGNAEHRYCHDDGYICRRGVARGRPDAWSRAARLRLSLAGAALPLQLAGRPARHGVHGCNAGATEWADGGAAAW